MKKTIALICLFTLLLTGCGNAKSLDFKSVLDTETGNAFSLGDNKSKFDKALGDGVYDEQYKWYYYVNELMTVSFTEDHATMISVRASTNRFEFKDMSITMKQADIEGRFVLDYTGYGYSWYCKYYDTNGKTATEDTAKFVAEIFMDTDGTKNSLAVMTYEYYNR